MQAASPRRAPPVSLPKAGPPHSGPAVTMARWRPGLGLTALPLRVVGELAEGHLHREDEAAEHDLDANLGDGHVHLDADLGDNDATFLEAGAHRFAVEDDLDADTARGTGGRAISPACTPSPCPLAAARPAGVSAPHWSSALALACGSA